MAAEEFSSQSIIFGLEGIDLKRTLDLIKPTRLARMTNVYRNQEGALEERRGITTIVSSPAGTTMHSIIRMTGVDILGAVTQHYVVLVDSLPYWGTSGGLAASAPPIGQTPPNAVIMCPVTFSDTTIIATGHDAQVWAAIPCATETSGFTQTNLMVREQDGVCHTLGIFPQTALNAIGSTAVSVALATESKIAIDNCDVAGWTNNAGTGGAPANVADAVIKKEGAASLKLTTNQGGAAGLYYNFWNKANAINLGTASDDDIIHLWVMTDRPDLITELRVYFVVAAAAFNVNTIPGTSATLNTDAYYKSFRPSDFTSIYEVTSSTTPVAATTNATLTTLNGLPAPPTPNPALELLSAEMDPSIRASVQMAGGRGSWQEVGIIGFPLRRGDFGRIGTDSTRTWANITGLVIAAQINTNAAANIWFDDIYLTGGAGPDSSPVGATQYDYRYTHFCLETGEESNPSDIQIPQNISPAFAPHDALRRGLVITPVGYSAGTSGLTFHQRIYRRGGTLGNNWYFVGENTGDGAAFPFTDNLSDLEIIAAPTLQIDNDPSPLLASIWGPINGIVFGCAGNTPREAIGGGTLVWTKVDTPGSWPPAYSFEVCSLSEELMAGFAQAGQGYVFSREALYTHTPDLSNAAIMNVVPTQCKKGLAARAAFAAYQAGVFFLSRDGVYFSAGPGGAEKNITDDFIEPIFRGQFREGYQPIDWSQPEAISMEVFESEIWLLYTGEGTLDIGSATGIIGDGTGPASGHAGAFGFAILCDDNSSNSVGPVQADVNGVWTITDVPVGTYTLVIYDDLDEAYRRDAGVISISANTLTNDGTRRLNTLGTHPACAGVGPPPAGDPPAKQVWIFNTLYQYWRHHLYGNSPARFYAQPGEDLVQNSTMLVGSSGPPALLGFISEINSTTDFNSANIPDSHIRTGALDQGIPRVSKLYGDAFVDVDVNGNASITVTPYINSEEQALTPTTLAFFAAGRQRYYIPIDEILARNISLDISWSSPGAGPPIIYQGGISYTPQPDTSETRVTNWDTQGRLNDKWVKGILFEVDTGGVAKSVNVLADGVVQQNITVQASGRQVLQFSFAQFRGRILRLAPTDTVQWIVYDFRWIFDEEPLSLLRWESQEIDHGFHGQQVPLFAHISIRSVADVLLTMTVLRQDGTGVGKAYILPNTLGAKVKLFVPFEATRGVLFKYEFTSEQPFWLYREESTVRIQPWGEAGFIEIAPFGNDDLDMPMRSMVDAGQASIRSGARH